VSVCVQLFKSNAVLTEYLYGREVVDIVGEFSDSVKLISCSDFIRHLRTLQPRYYSISSSPLLVCKLAGKFFFYSSFFIFPSILSLFSRPSLQPLRRLGDAVSAVNF